MAAPPDVRHDASDLEHVFARCFLDTHATRLLGGGAEPLYTPGTPDHPATLRYREDFFASALHEVAHWCIAGPARRRQLDFGYWYAPDGRTAAQQAAFERVEIAPQALEWVFADACGRSFHVSADNVDAGIGPGLGFESAVRARRETLLARGLVGRARRFRAALAAFYG